MIDPKLVDQIVEKIRQRGASYQYFFEHIESPEWILPLRERGFLTLAPEPIEDGNYIQFPAWPESQYLARVASLAPDLAVAIALEVAKTNNTRVQLDLLDIALAVPPEFGTKLVPFVLKWLERPLLLLPSRVADYISYLVRAGQIEAALTLSKRWLKILPGRIPEEVIKDGAAPAWIPEPHPQIEIWEYERFLAGTFLVLEEATPWDALHLLCELLQEALNLSAQAETPEFIDYSQVWRPAIEPHAQNSEHNNLRNVLVSAVRDAAVRIIQRYPGSLEEAVDKLDGFKWTVFKRISLFLVNKFGKSDMPLVNSKLTDHELFDDTAVYHEYMSLAHDYFGDLEEIPRDQILDWIEQGPDLTPYIDRETKRGQPPSEGNVTSAREYWQLRRLTVLKEVLPEAQKHRWETLVSKYAEPEHPDLLAWSSGVQWGPRSPITPDQLEEMTIEELSRFLREWSPPEGFTMESPEGLGRMLAEAVSHDPGKYLVEVDKLLGLDATYARGVISGLAKAVQARQSLDWDRVIMLFDWVVKQPKEISGRGADDVGDRDPSWGWTLKEIASLLDESLKTDKEIIPFEFRERIWEILTVICTDTEPSPAYEEQYGGSNMDPATLSLNTTRGQAIHALIAFAVWCRRHEALQDPTYLQKALGVLEEHLDISKDPSLAIRSVYGLRFNNLKYADHEWAVSVRDTIFVQDENLDMYWRAAWNAYVQFNQPTENSWKVLHGVYQMAIDRLDRPNPALPWAGNANERLAQHMMVYYWLGITSIDSPEFKAFWEKASKELRGHALDFIGRSLYNTAEEVPSEIIERLELLFRARLTQARNSEDKDVFAEELKAFGWWFASGKFDNKSAFITLADVLKMFGEVDGAHLVAKRLSVLAQEYPLETVSSLGALIEGDQKGWGIHTYRDDAKLILRYALASSDENARSASTQLINQLGARGYLDFGDLLRGA